jgi:KipI family sensor histidine kinase inhibitor
LKIVSAGDSALVAEFEERIDPAVNARVVSLAAALDRAHIVGIRDVVPTYRSVTVYFDPQCADRDALVSHIKELSMRSVGGTDVESRAHRVPVCYGGDLGPDLEAVARFAGLSVAGVVLAHTGRTYRVFMLGFLPGFAYMGPVDDRIAAPRQTHPRTRVPGGSVGVAGVQTGIYPCETPGGWQIVGRTPLRTFDATRAEPALLRPGDTVQFHAVVRSEFDRLAAEAAGR